MRTVHVRRGVCVVVYVNARQSKRRRLEIFGTTAGFRWGEEGTCEYEVFPEKEGI